MADAGIKRVAILKKDLPPVNSTNSYMIRYRVVSDDKNRTSHWSPIFNIDASNVVPVSGTLVRNNDAINVIWGDGSNRPAYDVFVKFDNGAYAYHGTSLTHSYSFLKTGSINVRALIQVASSLKEIVAGLKVFESSTVSLA